MYAEIEKGEDEEIETFCSWDAAYGRFRKLWSAFAESKYVTAKLSVGTVDGPEAGKLKCVATLERGPYDPNAFSATPNSANTYAVAFCFWAACGRGSGGGNVAPFAKSMDEVFAAYDDCRCNLSRKGEVVELHLRVSSYGRIVVHGADGASVCYPLPQLTRWAEVGRVQFP